MKEREAAALQKKRKREGGEGEEDGEDEGAEDVVNVGKRQKGEEDADAAEAKRRAKAERKKEKRERKKEKKAKAEARKARKQERDLVEAEAEKQQAEQEDGNDDEMEVDAIEKPSDMEQVDVSGLSGSDKGEAADHNEEGPEASAGSSAPTTPVLDSPAFDFTSNHSTTSSSSSIIPPSSTDQQPQAEESNDPAHKPRNTISIATNENSPKPAKPHSGTASPKVIFPDIDHELLKERLQKKIDALRASRKADGPEGKPAKSRQELLEQRRKKEEQRKEAKKAQRQKAKEEEQRKRDEQLRGSGSPLSMDIFSPRSPQTRENNFTFSKLSFGDGTSADASMSTLQDPKKKKGPQDPRTALQAAQNKQSRIAGYDVSKRADIADKDMWLHAKQRAHGERVRDDTSLLKKALKRQDKQKAKSSKEWQQREQAMVKGKEMRQKKREGNLAKRREEKGAGSKGKKKSGGGGGGVKKKGRPGFEGRFKA